MDATHTGRLTGGGFGSPSEVLLGRPRVPGQACPGERARRRAVERQTKAGVPVARCESPRLCRDRQSLSKFPASVGQGLEPRPVRTRVAQQKVEVIRDQFRLYVWAAVSS